MKLTSSPLSAIILFTFLSCAACRSSQHLQNTHTLAAADSLAIYSTQASLSLADATMLTHLHLVADSPVVIATTAPDSAIVILSMSARRLTIDTKSRSQATTSVATTATDTLVATSSTTTAHTASATPAPFSRANFMRIALSAAAVFAAAATLFMCFKMIRKRIS